MRTGANLIEPCGQSRSNGAMRQTTRELDSGCNGQLGTSACGLYHSTVIMLRVLSLLTALWFYGRASS